MNKDEILAFLKEQDSAHEQNENIDGPWRWSIRDTISSLGEGISLRLKKENIDTVDTVLFENGIPTIPPDSEANLLAVFSYLLSTEGLAYFNDKDMPAIGWQLSALYLFYNNFLPKMNEVSTPFLLRMDAIALNVIVLAASNLVCFNEIKRVLGSKKGSTKREKENIILVDEAANKINIPPGPISLKVAEEIQTQIKKDKSIRLHTDTIRKHNKVRPR